MRRRWLSALVVVGVGLALLPAAPAAAQGPVREYLYGLTDPYLADRVQEVTDTSDVMLAVRFSTTVSGTVSGVRICLDLSTLEVDHRLPVLGKLWTADGQLLASGGASEGIGYLAPCWAGFPLGAHLDAGQTYVVGFWLRGGQYSYVPHGFDSERSNGAHLTATGSLYAYVPALTDLPFPTESWENADYLVTPEFTPDA